MEEEVSVFSPEQRSALIREYLGKTVEVIIDRPVGYVHHVKGITLHYTLNYGYLPGVIGGDGEEQDVYVLGVTEPLERFTGRVIGAVRRADDAEDKLVAAPEGMEFHQGEIAEAVHFVEQYFDSSYDCLLRKSCGIIPWRKTDEGIRYLLVLQSNRCWSFPKGHMERGEGETETALRELWEETGLTARPDCRFRAVVEYPLNEISRKRVVLFPGEVTGEPVPECREVKELRWVTAEEAKKLLNREQREMMDRVQAYLEVQYAENLSAKL